MLRRLSAEHDQRDAAERGDADEYPRPVQSGIAQPTYGHREGRHNNRQGERPEDEDYEPTEDRNHGEDRQDESEQNAGERGIPKLWAARAAVELRVLLRADAHGIHHVANHRT